MSIFVKTIIHFLIILSIFIFSTAEAKNKIITHYHPIFIPNYDKKDNLRIAIRMFYVDDVPYYLVVDPETFITEIGPAKNFNPRKKMDNKPGYFTMQKLQETPYLKALIHYTSPPYKLQNYGMVHAEKPINGEFLTIDMCPSVKPFEKDFFNTLVLLAKKNHHPTPVAISITGLWIIAHPKEFNWLITQAKKNKLLITWINHSYSHIYYADLPFQKNFLFTFNTHLSHEILATEKILIEHNQIPSVFFRAPGLASNEKIVLKLRKYGLIPIGSDAWLAFDQEPKQGSFILVHGNSNEPEGIKKIMPMLHNPNYHWLPLNNAFCLRAC